MHSICCSIAALTVACIYYSWRAYTDCVGRRERTLRDRITYMLWVMAGQVR